METLLFGTIGWNIAETTRMIEIAKLFKTTYDCHFLSYGGQFEHLVEEAGFTLHHLTPQETPEKIEHLWKVDRGESFKQPWTANEVALRIQSEVRLIKELKPRAAFLGSVLTFSVSCKLTHTVLFNFIPLALSRPYLEAGLPISPFYPKIVNSLGAWTILHVPLLLSNIRKVMHKLGLPKPTSLLELWEGDVNIIAETEELSLLKTLPENWYFSGPLFAHLEEEIPVTIEDILTHSIKPKVYFAMGSSANREVLLRVMKALGELDIEVIAPIKTHLNESDEIPSNIHVTDWLPALEVTSRVDLAVIHGGQGTVQTTVSAGVPFVGVGMQPEQDINIYLYAEYGNALQLKKKSATSVEIQAAVAELLTNDQYRMKAKEAQIRIAQSNTGDSIKRIVFNHLTNS